MSLYRCAACGSPNVMTDTQNEGVSYNYVKGAVGTVLLGAGGAAAGIQSKKTDVFKCPDCGMVLSYPMPSEIAMIIEAGLMNKRCRNNLKLRGVEMPWDYLVSKYKNMGIGVPNYENHEEIYDNTPDADLAREMIANLADIELDISLAEEEADHLEELQAAWEERQQIAKAKAEEEFGKAKEACALKYEKPISDAKEEVEKIKAEKSPVDSRIIEMENKLKQLNEKLSSLGIFKGAEKKATKAEIEEISAKLNAEKNVQNQFVGKLKTAEDIVKQLSKEEKQELKKLQNKYLPTEGYGEDSPYEKYKFLSMIKSLNQEIESAKANGRSEQSILILEAIKILLAELKLAGGRIEQNELIEYAKIYVRYCWKDASRVHMVGAVAGAASKLLINREYVRENISANGTKYFELNI